MTSQRTGFLTPYCSEHTTDEAKAICTEHHHLMCLECLISRPHQKHDCVIKDISKLEAENDKAIVDLVALTQAITRQEEDLDVFVNHVDTERQRLDNEIKVFYELLVEKLKERLSKTSEFSKKESERVKKELHGSKTELENMKKTIHQTLQKLQKINVVVVRENTEEVLVKLRNLPEKERFESHFYKSDDLLATMSRKKPLGDITMTLGQHIYDDALYAVTEPSQGKNLYLSLKDSRKVVVSKQDPVRLNKDKGGKSKEETYATSDTQDEKEAELTTSFPMPTSPMVNQKLKLPLETSREDKEKKGMVHSKIDKYQKEGEQVYGLIRSVPNRCLQLSPEERFHSMSISRLSSSDSGEYIALLDKTQNAIVIVDKTGKFLSSISKKECDQVLALTFAEDNKIAVLLVERERVKLRTFLLKDYEISKHTEQTLKVNWKDVLGLDYDHLKQRFAVTCNDKITLIHKSGTAETKPISKDTKYSKNKGSAEELFLCLTRYDFSQKCMFLLKVAPSKKTLKCLSRKKNCCVWKKELEEADFDYPRDMQLNNDFVIILCKSSIYRITKSEGELVNPPITFADLSDDALGMCIMKNENLALVSSDSKVTPELGFVAL